MSRQYHIDRNRYSRYEDEVKSEASVTSKGQNAVLSATICCYSGMIGEFYLEWRQSNLIAIILMILEVALFVAFVVSFHSDTDPAAFRIGDAAVEYLLIAYMTIGKEFLLRFALFSLSVTIAYHQDIMNAFCFYGKMYHVW